VVGVISAVLAIVLIFLVWWFCVRGRSRSNHPGGPCTDPPIESIEGDDYPLDGYDPSLQTVQPAARGNVVPRTRNRAGRQQSLARSSQRQDGLASVAQSVVGAPPPKGYVY
jgi:hypothetical protein